MSDLEKLPKKWYSNHKVEYEMKKLAEFGEVTLSRHRDNEGNIRYIVKVICVKTGWYHGQPGANVGREEGPSARYACTRLLDEFKEELFRECQRRYELPC